MPIKLITSDNINTAVRKTIEAARTAAGDSSSPVFVVVPDRFTLQCERILMQGVQALLNVRVVTFSMLYNIVSDELETIQSERKILDKTVAVLYMWRAVQEVSEQLVWFRKSVGYYSFAEKMFNTVNQLSSSMADFDNLEKNAAAEITRKKMHDIALIFRAYKKLTAERTDSGGMLGYLIENIAGSKLIKNSRVFITGFEHLSVQRSAVVLELIRTAKELTAGIRNESEFAVFLNEWLFNGGVQSSVVRCGEKFAGDILVNVFESVREASAERALTGNNCAVRELISVQEEAAWVANEISRLVKTGGVRFRDIVITLGDYEGSLKVFEQTFAQSGIAVNADVGSALLEMPLTLFLHNMVMLAGRGRCESIIAVLKSGFCGFSREEEFELENFCLKHNASISLLRKKFEDISETLRAAISKFNAFIGPYSDKLLKCRTAEGISEVLIDAAGKTGSLNSGGELGNTENVAREKLIKLLTQCAEVLGAQRMTLQEFSNMFGTLASATKVSVVPTFADAVTLVAAKEYEPSFVPYLFVCGCTAGVFPTEQDDTDIITEFDIANMKSRIEPTATMQNNRARIHAADILSSFTKKLFVAYASSDTQGEQGRASEAVERILGACEDGCVENVTAGGVYSEDLFCRSYAASTVLRSIGDGSAFEDAATYNSILKAVDSSGLRVPDFEQDLKPLTDAGRLFFPNSAASVTQFENFYKCPFYHFLQNGLKVRPRESVRAAANVMGSLVHKIVELFLNCIIENGLEISAAVEMKKCVAEVLNAPEFVYFSAEPMNRPIVESVKKQAQKIGAGLLANIKAGSYRPVYTEKRIELPIAGGLMCRGIVDRIDTANIDGRDYALVIDYKTGGNSNFSYKQLYLGTKLQLPLYLGALGLDFGMGGACYLPLRGGFSESSSENFKMNGIVLNTAENAAALDGELAGGSSSRFKSRVVPLSSKDGKIAGGVTPRQMTAVVDYASAMLEQAVRQAEGGHIAKSPSDAKVCRYCVYAAMCGTKGKDRGKGIPALTVRTIEKIVCGGGEDD